MFTQQLEKLPDVKSLKELCKRIAVLEAILSPDWEGRYYSYNKKWSETEEVFSMRNGSGDEFFILFNKAGAVINGFAHESSMSSWKGDQQTIWKGVVDSLPKEFESFIFGEPNKSVGTTFCLWMKYGDAAWQSGNIEFPNDDFGDGSTELLQVLREGLRFYRSWAEDYYGEEYEDYNWFDLPINLINMDMPITDEVVYLVNPNFEDWEQLRADLEEIGYPFTLKQ